MDNVEGTDYTGTVNTTVYRLKCKDWSNTGFNMTLDTQRLLADQHNYCRNSERDPLGPWCYTTDDDTLWQTCTIPVCDMLYTVIFSFIFLPFVFLCYRYSIDKQYQNMIKT